ncbi:MAG: hypothetical protein ACOZNI_19310 [Myxococcota bacterium]
MPWLLATLALAAEGAALVLPPGEDPAAWKAPATLAGFRVGDATASDRVEIVVSERGWTLRAWNAAGHSRVIGVAPARSADGREDVAWLAASLLHSLPEGPAPARSRPSSPEPAAPVRATAPAPPPRVAKELRPAERDAEAGEPVSPTPAVEAAPTAGPTVVVAGEPGSPTPAVQAAPTAGPTIVVADEPEATVVVAGEPPTPEPSAVALTTWVLLGPAVSWRDGTALAVAGELGAGVRSGSFWVGATGSPSTPRALAAAPEGTLSAVDVRAIAAWSPDLGVAPWLATHVGASWHRFGRADERLDLFPVPVLAAEAGAEVRMGPWLRLSPRLRVAGDLDRTRLVLPDRTVTLSPWQVEAALALRGAWE